MSIPVKQNSHLTGSGAKADAQYLKKEGPIKETFISVFSSLISFLVKGCNFSKTSYTLYFILDLKFQKQWKH